MLAASLPDAEAVRSVEGLGLLAAQALVMLPVMGAVRAQRGIVRLVKLSQ